MNNENIKQLEKKYEELGREIEALKEDKPWPQVGDEYYYIDSTGLVLMELWSGYYIDLYRCYSDNIFRDWVGAKNEVMHRKTISKMRGYAKGFKPNWDDHEQRKVCIRYDNDKKRLVTDVNWDFIDVNQVYFECFGDAEHCIIRMGDEIRKWVFGVEEVDAK